MKKVLLSGLVILSFIVYSAHQRGGDDSPNVIKPASSQTAPVASNQQSSQTSNTNTNSSGSTTYKDGQYTGSKADAFYGFIQVMAVISGGRLTEVRFLQYPHDNPTSVEINSQAMPYLQQEAIKAQSANVDIVSGATDTSQAFIQSLSSALNSAKA
jgi:uncharacterized protein with FMN-binding domain